jgi:hypothetical protein
MSADLKMHPDFILLNNTTKVKCTICAPHIPVPEKQWMLWQSHQVHSQSITHKTNLNQLFGSPFDTKVLAATAVTDADAAAQEILFESLETVSIQMQHHLVKKTPQASAVEQEMWNDYTNGAYYDIACTFVIFYGLTFVLIALESFTLLHKQWQ